MTKGKEGSFEPVPVDYGFAPLLGDTARVLILGSMPSQSSLAQHQYYAHPQNAFWRVMSQLTGVAHDAPYEARALAITRLGICVWDTIAQCARPGSMDSDIDPASVVVNNFDQLLSEHGDIARVLFNGRASEKIFHQHLGKGYLAERGIQSKVMPSTSPAYAAMPLDRKKALWFEELENLL